MWAVTAKAAGIVLCAASFLMPESVFAQLSGQTGLPKGAVRRLGNPRYLHPAAIKAVACFPDGSAFATAGGNAPVQLWSAETGELVTTFPVRWATSLAFFAGGSRLVVGDAFGTVTIFNVTDRSKVQRVEFPSPIATIHAHAQSLFVATKSGELYRLGLDGKKTKLAGRKGTVTAWAVDRGGTLAVVACRNRRLYAVPLGTTKGTFECEAPVPILSVAVTSDAILGGGENGEVFVWSRQGGKPQRKWQAHERPITGLAFVSDAGVISIDGHGLVRRWDISSGKRMASTRLPIRDSEIIAATDDGERILAGGESGRLHVLDSTTLEPLRTPPHGRPSSLAVTADGATAVVAYASGRIIRYRAGNGAVERTWDTDPQRPPRIALCKGDQALAILDDRRIRLVDLGRNEEAARIDWGNPLRLRCHAVDVMGTTLAAADTNGVVRIVSLAKKQVVRSLGTGRPVLAVAFAPGGKKVAVCSYEGVGLWDVASGRRILRLKTKQPCRSVAISPHGRLVAIGHLDGSITIWDMEGRLQQTCPFHESAVTAVAFSTCSQLLVSGSMAGKVVVWEIATAEPVCIRTAHTGAVNGVATGGMLAFSAGSDGAVYVWRLSGDLQQPLPLAANQLEEAWRDLAGGVEAGQVAAWRLLASGPAGLTLLDKKLNLPPRNKVRAWIELLDHERYAIREKAAANLLAVGPWVQSRLLEVLDNPPSLEVEVRISAILDKLHRSGSLTARQQKVLLKRVLQILARDGSPTARSLLERIAQSAVAESIVSEAAALSRRR